MVRYPLTRLSIKKVVFTFFGEGGGGYYYGNSMLHSNTISIGTEVISKFVCQKVIR